MTYYVVNNGSFQCIDNKVQICREGLPKIVSSNVPTFIEVVGPMKIVDKNPVVITKKTSTGKYNSYYTVHIYGQDNMLLHTRSCMFLVGMDIVLELFIPQII